MKISRFLVLLLLLIAPAAEARNEPMELIQRAGQRLYDLSRQYHADSRNSDFRAWSRLIVDETTAELRNGLVDPARRRDLALPNDEKITILQIAVLVGVIDWVELLLAQPEVWAGLDWQNEEFGSAWSMASIAPLFIPRICENEGMNMGAEILRGYHTGQPGGLDYGRIRQLLEDAGATPRPDLAREVWLAQCAPGQEKIPGVRERVANAPDILDAILAEAFPLK